MVGGARWQIMAHSCGGKQYTLPLENFKAIECFVPLCWDRASMRLSLWVWEGPESSGWPTWDMQEKRNNLHYTKTSWRCWGCLLLSLTQPTLMDTAIANLEADGLGSVLSIIKQWRVLGNESHHANCTSLGVTRWLREQRLQGLQTHVGIIGVTFPTASSQGPTPSQEFNDNRILETTQVVISGKSCY